MSEKDAVDFDEGWKTLQLSLISKLEDVLDRDFDLCNPPRRIFSVKQQTTHYTIVYNMCTRRDGSYEEILYRRYRETIGSFLRRKPFLEASEEPMRLRMAIVWTKFKTYIRVLGAAFSYLDRFYVELYGLMDLNGLAILQFRKLFMEYRDMFSSSIIEKYDNLRELPAVDEAQHIDLSVSLEIYNAIDPDNVLFKMDIEKVLIERTNDYYDKISRIWIYEYPLEDYMVIFNEILAQELDRCKLFFHDKVVEPLRDAIVTCMVKNRLERIKSKLFDCQDITGLDNALLYQTLSLLPEGIELIGSYLIKQMQSETELVNVDKMTDISVVHWVLGLSDKFGKIVDHCCLADKAIHKSFNRGIEWVLNHKIDSQKSAKYLATYANRQILKNCGIGDVMSLFHRLKNKRAFIEHYRYFLAARLLNNSPLDREVDAYNLLSKMAGSRSTAEIHGMIQDIDHSNTISSGITTDDVYFKPYCLSSDYWSDFDQAIKYPSSSVTVYPELHRQMAHCEKHYLSNLKHRTLRWVPSLSQITLTSDNLEIECNLVQATILLHYADNVTTINDIAALMDVQTEYVTYVILNMNKKCNIFAVNGSKLQLNSVTGSLCLLDDLNHGLAVACDTCDDSMSIDAAIIRSLKASKTLRLGQIIRSVQANLLEPLAPEVIMERIESMVLSGQIGHAPPDLYHYS
ncbi:cullin 1 [Babesia microti strain RI]|uniref:Cullin 1 n=1 Tax=Babesia microti (strain RI) TaxID=1133968 RepID=A0A1R4ABX2_BABMR|nr:cullin 1 [Babesia microti strain RI]SJK86513.1 cullin 1 [Babesia microti strain RI]|eukprot:XP_021338664.1 cullin 1 [Babesia microti strain RI]